MTGRECYAKALGNCKGKLTDEHYVSEHVLSQFEVGGELNVAGLPFAHLLGGRSVSASSLTARILCEKHNNDLSPVDTVWGKFLMEFFTAHNALLDGTLTTDSVLSIDGTLLERWMLKFASGWISSGNARLDGGQTVAHKTPPPIGLLRMLYALDPFPNKWGWYTLAPAPKTSDDRMHFGLTPTYENHSETQVRLSGVKMDHYGFVSFVRLITPMLPHPGIDLSQFQYRPEFFEISRESTGRKAMIQLAWPMPKRGNGFKVAVVGEGEKPPATAVNPA